MPVLAEWDAPGTAPVGGEAPELPVLNLAARERRTVAVADIEDAPELDDPSLGSDRQPARARHQGRARDADPRLRTLIGVFGLHRARPAPVDGLRADAPGVGRPRGRPRDPHGPPARGERAAAGAVGCAAQGVAVRHGRAAARDRAPAPRRRGHTPAARRRSRLLPLRHAPQRAHAARPSTASTPTSSRSSSRPDRGLAGEALRQGRGLLSEDYKTIDEPVPHPPTPASAARSSRR